jgi:type II secretory pathway component GspD/PulD (secretin)
MVFIKPSIVNNDNDAHLVSQMKYQIIQREQANYRGTLDSLSKNTSVRKKLPPWQNPKDLPTPFGATTL